MNCFFFNFFLQQAKEMVNEILRERDHAGFGDRNEYGSRMGGGGSGLNVCMKHLGTVGIAFPINVTYFFPITFKFYRYQYPDTLWVW